MEAQSTWLDCPRLHSKQAAKLRLSRAVQCHDLDFTGQETGTMKLNKGHHKEQREPKGSLDSTILCLAFAVLERNIQPCGSLDAHCSEKHRVHAVQSVRIVK